MNVLDILDARGFIHQTTDDPSDRAKLRELLGSPPVTAYIGFDPTASSLHVGSLVQIMALVHLQNAGHRPIAVVGGGTGLVGDPSGKEELRQFVSRENVDANLAAIREQFARYIDFDDGRALILNNAEWLVGLNYLEFLRDYGRHFSVNRMLAHECFKIRYTSDSGLSFLEFNYMLLQAYDFLLLFRDYGCKLQMGGSDQWGNITAGIDLARRMRGVQLYGITGPLLTKSDGAKMGKTEAGTIWLSSQRTSPYMFYQYWFNTADEDTGTCLRFLTELCREEIEALDESRADDPSHRKSQIQLAQELTRLVHGDEGLATAERARAVLFGGRTIKDFNDTELTEIFADVASRELPQSRLAGEGLNIVDAFFEVGLTKSKGEARRIVQQGGANVNNQRVDSIDTQLTEHNLASETVMILRSGKKKYALLKFV